MIYLSLVKGENQTEKNKSISLHIQYHKSTHARIMHARGVTFLGEPTKQQLMILYRTVHKHNTLARAATSTVYDTVGCEHKGV